MHHGRDDADAGEGDDLAKELGGRGSMGWVRASRRRVPRLLTMRNVADLTVRDGSSS